MSEALLSQFVGRWRGSGRVEYPTMDSLEYTDELTVVATHKPTMVRYEQRTIKVFPDGRREPSHMELGFLRLRPDGAVEWSNVQSGGRVEVLVGAISPGESGGAIIALNQTLLGNDDRMKDSARIIQVNGDRLEYRQEMALVAVPDLQFHTTAVLYRMPLMMI